MIARSIVAALGLVAVASTAAAEDAGLEWKRVSATASKIRVTESELADRARYFTAQTSDYSANLHIARVTTEAHRGDRLQILYIELLPGRHFQSKYDVKKVLGWKPMTDGHAREIDRFSVATHPGVYDVLTFMLDGNVPCAAFSTSWGTSGHEFSSAGTRQARGYGCEAGGAAFDRDRVKAMLDSLEYDD